MQTRFQNKKFKSPKSNLHQILSLIIRTLHQAMQITFVSSNLYFPKLTCAGGCREAGVARETPF